MEDRELAEVLREANRILRGEPSPERRARMRRQLLERIEADRRRRRLLLRAAIITACLGALLLVG